jgi:undecaprenyl-diphosphatase
VGAIILLGCAILFSASRRAWPETAFLVIASAVRLLAGLLKPVFDSPRPPPDLVIVSGTFHGSGYPSGHAMTGAVIGLAFAVLAWRGIADRRLAAATAILSLATGFMVGWSRIALGAHWPSDVLGGFLAGIAIVAFAAGVVTRFEATGGRNQWT